jgi:hypothetical protein
VRRIGSSDIYRETRSKKVVCSNRSGLAGHADRADQSFLISSPDSASHPNLDVRPMCGEPLGRLLQFHLRSSIQEIEYGIVTAVNSNISRHPLQNPPPYWDLVLDHISTGLHNAVETSEWCQDHEILTSADYFRRWIATSIRMPMRRLPNTGQSIIHEAVSELFDP